MGHGRDLHARVAGHRPRRTRRGAHRDRRLVVRVRRRRAASRRAGRWRHGRRHDPSAGRTPHRAPGRLPTPRRRGRARRWFVLVDDRGRHRPRPRRAARPRRRPRPAGHRGAARGGHRDRRRSAQRPARRGRRVPADGGPDRGRPPPVEHAVQLDAWRRVPVRLPDPGRRPLRLRPGPQPAMPRPLRRRAAVARRVGRRSTPSRAAAADRGRRPRPTRPRVPAADVLAPPRRPEPAVEPILDQGAGRDWNELLTYEGNWRDIFQNWEALLHSYPAFFPHVVAKFVNASTADGHNPYRISRDGVDWEVPDPDDPWSNIGYWGDHQIVYLLRLLEGWRAIRSGRARLVGRPRAFVYADVPYTIADTRRWSATRRTRSPTTPAGPTGSPARGRDRRRRAAPRRRRRRLARVGTAREAARAGAGEAVGIRSRRRDLDEHPAPGVERRQQRAGRQRPVDGHAHVPGRLPGVPARPDQRDSPVGPSASRRSWCGGCARSPTRSPRSSRIRPTPAVAAS